MYKIKRKDICDMCIKNEINLLKVEFFVKEIVNFSIFLWK